MTLSRPDRDTCSRDRAGYHRHTGRVVDQDARVDQKKPQHRTFWSRFPHRTVPLAAASLVLLALSVLCFWSRAVAPSDGTVINVGDLAFTGGKVVVQQVRPGSPLRHEDQILEIDGRVLADQARPGALDAEVGEQLTYVVLRDGQRMPVPVMLQPYPVVSALANQWPMVLLISIIVSVALFIYANRPRDPAARASLMIAMTSQFCSAGSGYFKLEALDLVAGTQFWRWYLAQIGFALLWGSILHFALSFPTALASRRRRLWVALAYLGPLLLYLGDVAVRLPWATTALTRWELVGAPVRLLVFVYPALVFVMLVYRYHTCEDTLAKQRLRWLAATLGGASLLYVLLWIAPEVLWGTQPVPRELYPVVFMPAPLALAAAVLRYHALNIEVVVSRSLAYAFLSATVGVGYAAIVSILSTTLPRVNSLWHQAIAAGVAAALTLPLRDRVHAMINQRLFGARQDPYRVVSVLSDRLQGTKTPKETVQAVVETVGQALRLPYAAIELRRGEGSEQVAVFGTPVGLLTRLPLSYQGEVLGDLVVARGPRERFNRKDRAVLTDIARHAGAIVHTARLTTDLARSRAEIVQAREEERRRLLHDLHDGVGPTLAAATLGLQASRRLLITNPPAAKDMLHRLEDDLQNAIGEIRRVANELRPPVLDQLGLVTAVREHANTLAGRLGPLSVEMDLPEELPALPAAVEVAAYRIVCEALTNVARHSKAQRCAVRLGLDGGLTLEIADDGVGLPARYRDGVGLHSMRERAVELGGSCTVESEAGGGTRVLARLPLPEGGS
ncbi:Histidine kinase-, DNA gyrase B-, and HSP90-like ATPase [Allokutzneria albata]|uniref:Histidine kinase-, DNA gyrase B-, and HSP90-like ATPase n=1 Tax=Allokutzneria albata TaxID=211114 RepID=A0A1H0BR55_ALLAB|nr:Histidine kinase-, DNA gyrase B-, and HSP90-like ATPase [Allokutzneria albata]